MQYRKSLKTRSQARGGSCNTGLEVLINRMRKTAWLATLVFYLFSAQFFISAKAGNFAWGCFGPEVFGKGLRIIKANEPGSEVVIIRTRSNVTAIKLTAAGPETEVVVPNVGRNGEDGVMVKRAYSDSKGRRWICSNWDAHPAFKLHETNSVAIHCCP